MSPHRREAVLLRRVRQGIHPGGPDDQALGHAQEEAADLDELNQKKKQFFVF